MNINDKYIRNGRRKVNQMKLYMAANNLLTDNKGIL